MAKRMRADVLCQACTPHRRLNGLIDNAGINMMTTGDSRARVNGEITGGEDILPTPFLGSMGVFPRQSVGKVHVAMPLSQVPLVQRLDPGQMVLE
jgi:hypothetical protein